MDSFEIYDPFVHCSYVQNEEEKQIVIIAI